jgi:PKD repeat protein
MKWSWKFTYDGVTKALEGEVVSFTFNRGGAYLVVLTVADSFGNLDHDKVIITVVDTGNVTGTVLDRGAKPIEGASVEIIASDGITHTTKTAANGSFKMDIHCGKFTWKVEKEGYRTISGNSSVNAMDEVREEFQLAVPDRPTGREDGEGLPIQSLILVLSMIIAVAAAVGIGIYAVIRKKKAQKIAPPPTSDKPAPEEAKTPPGGPT